MSDEEKQTMMSWFKHMANKIPNAVYDFQGTVIRVLIALVTVALQAIIAVTAYKCPCVSPDEVKNCTSSIGSGECSKSLNFYYGLSFIVAPAVALLVFGIASNPKLWKAVTGSLNPKSSKFDQPGLNVTRAIGQTVGLATIAPLTWVVVTLLDGRFFACAVTALPYDTDPALPNFATCQTRVGQTPPVMSNNYNNNKRFYQLVGWIGTGVCLFVGFLIYALIQFYAPLTYYHNKYYKLYRTSEQSSLVKQMKQKAKQDTEENVALFIGEHQRRPIKLWDKFSEVYEFRWNKENFPRYSFLHQWAEKIKAEKDPEQTQEKQQENENKKDVSKQEAECSPKPNTKLQAKKKKTCEEDSTEKAGDNDKESFIWAGVTISNFSGTFANIAVSGFTVAIQEIIKVAEYSCPCVSAADLKCAVDSQGKPACSCLMNKGYGVAFIAAPAIALLLFGMVINPKLWKVLTSCVKQRKAKKLAAKSSPTRQAATSRQEVRLQQCGPGQETPEDEDDDSCRDMTWAFVKTFAMATIAPITWVAVAFLDGQFYACASTPLPYYLTSTNGTQMSCAEVPANDLVISNEYINNRRLSQIIGWLMIACSLIVGFAIFTIVQCFSPLTYFHEKFYRIYRAAEEASFKRVIANKVNERATENAEVFLSAPRGIEAWNKISQLHRLPKEKEVHVVYSYLDEWVTDNATSQQLQQNRGTEQQNHVGKNNGVATSNC